MSSPAAANPSRSFGVTLDRWTQDPQFSVAQGRMKLHAPDEWHRVEEAVTVFAVGARERGFTGEEVLAYLGRETVRRNLIGAVLGHFRSRGILRVVSRERSVHPEARGRWVNRFVLAEATR